MYFKKYILLLVLTGFGNILFAQAHSKSKNQTQTEPVEQKGNQKTPGETVPDGTSNETIPQSQLVEGSYPLANNADRAKSVKLMQQITVDLLALSNQNKESHWNVNGPLFLSLHEFFDYWTDYYRDQSDLFAERALQLGYSIDGRYSTIAKTTRVPDMPAGFLTDNEALKLMIAHTTILQKEIYTYIDETEQSDAVISNKLQDLGYNVDKNLWQLRIHLQKPGSPGENLPWTGKQQ